ncbi:bifunctional DENN domain [Babesia duncani]|uniref:Bifunctional DENN domain n=1 Tax=Babesia duncani TaxID=323732 RepID=A0AAD9PMT7_9APIC|nr:bifunctional DENN domain [Babesia duncani]
MDDLEKDLGDCKIVYDEDSDPCLYDPQLHGSPIAAVMLVKSGNADGSIEYCYPKHIQQRSLFGGRKPLRYSHLQNSFRGKRNIDDELVSCFHLIPKAALGPMKPKCLVDFVYFMLPTSEGTVFHGVSYVARFNAETGELDVFGRKSDAAGTATSWHSPKVPETLTPKQNSNLQHFDDEENSVGTSSDGETSLEHDVNDDRDCTGDDQDCTGDLRDASGGITKTVEFNTQANNNGNFGVLDDLSDTSSSSEWDMESQILENKLYFSFAEDESMSINKEYLAKFSSEETPSNIYYMAVVAICTVPFYGYIACKLEYIAQAYFNSGNFSDTSLLSSFMDQFNSKEIVTNWGYDLLVMNLEPYMKPFSLYISYRIMLFIIKSILVCKKVVIYAKSAARVSSAILSLLSAIPGAISLGFNSEGFGSLWYGWKKFALPLHIFHSKNIVLPYMTEDMIPLLQNTDGYLIGVCDDHVLDSLNNVPDILLDVETEFVQLNDKNLVSLYGMSMYEVSHFHSMLECMEVEEDSDDELHMVSSYVKEKGMHALNTIGNYFGKAPTAFIKIGGKIKKVMRHKKRPKQKEDTGCKKKESPLKLLEMYFPGFIPSWMMKHSFGNAQQRPKPMMEMKQPVPDSEYAFTFAQAFLKMYRDDGRSYKYFGFFENLCTIPNVPDRNKEVEFAINNCIKPVHEYFLKLLSDVAFVVTENRCIFNLLLDFEFDIGALIDNAYLVVGIVARLDGKYIRGSVLREDGETAVVDSRGNPIPLNRFQRDNYDIAVGLASKIVQAQDMYGLDFLEMWIQTIAANNFVGKNNLETFRSPKYIDSGNHAQYNYQNGDVYTGELVDLLRHGHGCYVTSDGSNYKGEWARDKRHGVGTLVSTRDNYMYSGSWKFDYKHGHGILETKDYKYTGFFKRNKMHGTGKLERRNGFTYEGDFKYDKFNGRGKMTLPDGTIKMGTLKDDQFVGICSVVSPDGSIYVGTLFGDAMHGHGTLRYNQTTHFEGIWQKGKRFGHGACTITGPQGKIQIESVWQDDVMDMDDVLIKYPSGCKYNGSMEFFPESFDILKLLSDVKIQYANRAQGFQDLFATLENRLLPHGSGTSKIPGCGSYSGDYICGLRFGQGRMVFTNGLVYNGSWEFGVPASTGTVFFPEPSQEGIDITFDSNGRLATALDPERLEILNQSLATLEDLIHRDFCSPNLEPIPKLYR